MRYLYLMVFVLVVVACNEEVSTSTIESSDTPFESIDAEYSGVKFSNNLKETEKINRLTYEYFYNGGGVAASDINNDGLPDLYFTGNMIADKLYVNRGDFKFEDITTAAGISHSGGWHTGVSIVDVNNDGYKDIYVCRAGWFTDTNLRRNLLYINNKNNTFTESARRYGLDDNGASVQASFFDADADGDLDVYVLNNPDGKPDTQNMGAYKKVIDSGTLTSDKYYENVGGKFIDKTKQAGFNTYGFRHGIIVGDFNNDNYPDLYLSTDFDEPDYFFINQKNGKFKNEIDNAFMHTSMFSMGNDAGDINNDGLLDLMVVDMTPGDHQRSKQNMPSMNAEKFYGLVNNGFGHQYMVNSLQLNTGNLKFSEIANMSGVAYSDWSWAPLIFDWDLDGFQDIFITNGVKRDVLNNDLRINAMKAKSAGKQLTMMDILDMMPSTKLTNPFYKNNGDLTFTNMQGQWIDGKPTNSNGAAYADLDNDGDWDLVVNNVDDIATIHKNGVREKGKNNFIKVKFDENSWFNAEVTITQNGRKQSKYIIPTRGYNSSVEHALIFGLAENSDPVNIEIKWPGKKSKSYNNQPVNKTVYVNKVDLSIKPEPLINTAFIPGEKIDFTHKESYYNDFEKEILLPHKQSSKGPAFAKGDVNSDGIEDLFVGGALGQSSALFLGDKSGFKKSNVGFGASENYEAQDALFIDIDQDGDLDIYVANGSNEIPSSDPRLHDLIYINNGKGDFNNVQKIKLSSTSKVLNLDGEVLAFGGVENGTYPYVSQTSKVSFQEGKFIAKEIKFTEDININDATISGDKIFITGAWEGIRSFAIQDDKFVESTPENLKNLKGWWQSIHAVDLDGDGDEDLVCGNIGLNNKFHPSTEKPLKLFYSDFDQNGTKDIVLSKKYKGEYVPVRGRECSSEQMPFIKEKYPTFKEFSESSIIDILGDDEIENAAIEQANTFASVWIENNNGSYIIHQLPNEAQMGPLRNVITADFDKDGSMDIFGVGNLYDAEVETVRYDANPGFLLKGKGDGDFEFVPANKSGIQVFKDSRKSLWFPEKELIVIANNNDDLTIYRQMNNQF